MIRQTVDMLEGFDFSLCQNLARKHWLRSYNIKMLTTCTCMIKDDNGSQAMATADYEELAQMWILIAGIVSMFFDVSFNLY